ICGLNYPSDVEAGHALGVAAYVRLKASPGFAADLEAARAALAAERRKGLLNPGCAAERSGLRLTGE
ncbi:MAG TPA: PA-phosphatase, partial [Caulobacteraceae bacterium]